MKKFAEILKTGFEKFRRMIGGLLYWINYPLAELDLRIAGYIIYGMHIVFDLDHNSVKMVKKITTAYINYFHYYLPSIIRGESKDLDDWVHGEFTRIDSEF